MATNINLNPNLDFLSLGVNRINDRSMDWLYVVRPDLDKYTNFNLFNLEQSLVVYIANRSLALFKLEDAKPSDANYEEKRKHQHLPVTPLVTLEDPSDSGTLSGVKFIYDNLGYPYGILSGSTTGTLNVWLPSPNSSKPFYLAYKLLGHSSPITCLTTNETPAFTENLKDILVVAGSIDNKLTTYQLPNQIQNKAELIQIEPSSTHLYKAKYPLSASLTYLPNTSTPLLAVGLTDCKVAVYLYSTQLELVATLKGHEDWITSVSFTKCPIDLEDGSKGLWLATGSQDRSIRVWKLAKVAAQASDNEAAEVSILDQLLNEAEVTQISTKAYLFNDNTDGSDKSRWSLSFDALLLAHDGWVNAVSWHPPTLDLKTDATYQPAVLLSSSEDKSVLVWAPDKDEGIWINEAQLGEVGGSALGFYSARFGPNGHSLIAVGYYGALHYWALQPDSDSTECSQIDGSVRKDWLARPSTTSGHFKPVLSVAWDPSHPYLVTSSTDQTARAFARYSTKSTPSEGTWHELARTQIHGYDLRKLAFIQPYRYVSVADEKVIRIFEAPQPFVDRLNQFTDPNYVPKVSNEANRALGASLPALGLSNKPVAIDYSGSYKPQQDDIYAGKIDGNVDLIAPHLTNLSKEDDIPLLFEADLMQSTLWPELDKLYGHGYEVMAVAASPDSQFIASTCRATSATHATIRLFKLVKQDAKPDTYLEVAPPLPGHQLTVTCIDFSPDGNFLVSASRDRAWNLFRKNETSFGNVVSNAKAHLRIIWDCKFAPNSKHFLTGSRDKTVKVWNISLDPQNEVSTELIDTLNFEHAVTALAFLPQTSMTESELGEEKWIFAVGLESGSIIIGQHHLGQWKILQEIPSRMCPIEQINQLAFQPNLTDSRRLAVVSNDFSVRILSIEIL